MAAAAERARHLVADAQRRAAEDRLRPLPSLGATEFLDDSLDEVSNSVVDMIKEKRFDEALAVCERLRVEFPEVHDWLERSAMVHEAKGDLALAIDFYRRTLIFIEQPELREGYDEEVFEYFRDRISKLQAQLAADTQMTHVTSRATS